MEIEYSEWTISSLFLYLFQSIRLARECLEDILGVLGLAEVNLKLWIITNILDLYFDETGVYFRDLGPTDLSRQLT